MEVPGYKFIEIVPGVLAGQAKLKDTRISIVTILEDMSLGADVDKIIEYYPSLSKEMVYEALRYASEEMSKRRVKQIHTS
jgi:uncharacterized protein (DUF433 family)